MIRFGIFLACALTACQVANDAAACNRCRLGYKVYHAPIVQKQIVERVIEKNHYIPQQTIIFNNAHPAAAPGATSYQAFASAFAPSANGLIALASQQSQSVSAVASLASQQAATEASLAAMAIERDKIVAISEHLRAGLRGAGGSSQTLVLQIGADGSVRQVEPEQVRPEPGQEQRLPQGSVIADRCAKCHSGAKPEAEFYLDGRSEISAATAWRAVKAVNKGKMPPASEPELTPEEKQSILDELEALETEN